MILVNGIATEQLPVSDRGLQYGDGVFETVAYHHGQLRFLTAHLDRLSQGCKRLGIDFQQRKTLKIELHKICGELDAAKTQNAVVKIIVTRGSGGRGYQAPIGVEPTRIISTHDWPSHSEDNASKGVNVRLCHQRLVDNPTLAGIKHLNRLEQILARNEWDDDGIAEGLMCNAHGDIVEGTFSNIFIVKSGMLITPPLDRCGIEGITRATIMDIAGKAGIPCHQAYIRQQDLYGADEVFMCNSIIGIWPIKQIEQQTLPVGAITALLQAQLSALEIVV
jgi:4-amino-4-deoxychorismate lyase